MGIRYNYYEIGEYRKAYKPYYDYMVICYWERNMFSYTGHKTRKEAMEYARNMKRNGSYAKVMKLN